MIVGLTASTFDLLHAGHIAMLREAKAVCDVEESALKSVAAEKLHKDFGL